MVGDGWGWLVGLVRRIASVRRIWQKGASTKGSSPICSTREGVLVVVEAVTLRFSDRLRGGLLFVSLVDLDSLGGRGLRVDLCMRGIRQAWQGQVGAAMPLLVAVSGGADSMVLAELLWRALPTAPQYWYHCDHQLRPESAADAVFVAEAAAARGLRLLQQRVAVAERAAAWGVGLEEAGRRVRLQGYRWAARRVGARVVALAHHRDDQVETVLSNILRGAGPLGEAGMPSVRHEDELSLWRPLLAYDRAALRDWAWVEGIGWREDASNTDRRFRRNWLRHKLLPEWEAQVPGFGAALAAWAGQRQEALAERDVRLAPAWQQARRAQRWAVHELTHLARDDRWHCWQWLIQELGWPRQRQTWHRLDDLLAGSPDRRLSLAGRTVLRRLEWLDWRSVTASAVGAVVIAGPGVWRRCGARLSVEAIDGEMVVTRDPWIAEVDRDRLQGTLCWRSIVPGDRWRALGAGGSRGLQRWLRDKGLSVPERRARAVIADEAGVIWVPGFTIAERVRLRAESRRAWRLRYDDRQAVEI